MGTYLILHATYLKQMTQTQTHPLYNLNAHLDPQINYVAFKCKKILLGARASKNFDGSSSIQYQNLALAPARTPSKLAGSVALGSDSPALIINVRRQYKVRKPLV